MNGHSDSTLTNGNSDQKAAEEDAEDPPMETLTPEARPGEELIVMQDTGFNIKIIANGLEPFDMMVIALLCIG